MNRIGVDYLKIWINSMVDILFALISKIRAIFLIVWKKIELLIHILIIRVKIRLIVEVLILIRSVKVLLVVEHAKILVSSLIHIQIIVVVKVIETLIILIVIEVWVEPLFLLIVKHISWIIIVSKKVRFLLLHTFNYRNIN